MELDRSRCFAAVACVVTGHRSPGTVGALPAPCPAPHRHTRSPLLLPLFTCPLPSAAPAPTLPALVVIIFSRRGALSRTPSVRPRPPPRSSPAHLRRSLAATVLTPPCSSHIPLLAIDGCAALMGLCTLLISAPRRFLARERSWVPYSKISYHLTYATANVRDFDGVGMPSCVPTFVVLLTLRKLSLKRRSNLPSSRVCGFVVSCVRCLFLPAPSASLLLPQYLSLVVFRFTELQAL